MSVEFTDGDLATVLAFHVAAREAEAADAAVDAARSALRMALDRSEELWGRLSPAEQLLVTDAMCIVEAGQVP